MKNSSILANVEIITKDSVAKVLINGVDLSPYVTRLEYIHEGGEIPRLNLEIPLEKCNINSNRKIMVLLPDEITDLMKYVKNL